MYNISHIYNYLTLTSLTSDTAPLVMSPTFYLPQELLQCRTYFNSHRATKHPHPWQQQSLPWCLSYTWHPMASHGVTGVTEELIRLGLGVPHRLGRESAMRLMFDQLS